MYTHRYKHRQDEHKQHRETDSVQEPVRKPLPTQHTQTLLSQTHTTHRLTDGPDDSLLQLPLLMSFDDLGADVGVAVIGAGQLVVHTQAELPQ